MPLTLFSNFFRSTRGERDNIVAVSTQNERREVRLSLFSAVKEFFKRAFKLRPDSVESSGSPGIPFISNIEGNAIPSNSDPSGAEENQLVPATITTMNIDSADRRLLAQFDHSSNGPSQHGEDKSNPQSNSLVPRTLSFKPVLPIKENHHKLEPKLFDIHGSLGRGTMGEVFEGSLKVEYREQFKNSAFKNGYKVAIKRLKGLPDQDRHIIHETQIHKQVQLHPNIVPYIGHFQDSRDTFIVMERLHGPDMRTALRNYGRLTEIEVLCVMKQVFDALKFMHDSGFAHLDIKPANLVYQHSLAYPRNLKGPIRIIDFGLAESVINKIRGARGTPIYSAPEVDVPGSEYCGTSADIWSAGILMYELLSGTVPYKGRTFLEVTENIIENGELALMHSAELSYVSKYLKRLIMGCLHVDPKLRLTAREAYDEILLCAQKCVTKRTFSAMFYKRLHSKSLESIHSHAKSSQRRTELVLDRAAV